MGDTTNYCGLHVCIPKCELIGKRYTQDSICCDFCKIESCKYRCLNSWKKCGVLEVVRDNERNYY